MRAPWVRTVAALVAAVVVGAGVAAALTLLSRDEHTQRAGGEVARRTPRSTPPDGIAPAPATSPAVEVRVERAGVELEAFFARERFRAFLAVVAAEEAARAARVEAAHAPATAPGDPLACIRARESDTAGGYRAVSPDGRYRGAYQFLASTWDATAASAGRPDLVGVDPAAASPADQDAMAWHLYGRAGSGPWGGSC